MMKIQAKTEEKKKRADEIQMALIDADRARDQAKIEADKELALKEMELKAQAQASTNATVDPPPRIRDAKSQSYQPS